MSSDDDKSPVLGAEFDSAGAASAGGRPVRPTTPWGLQLGLDLGPARSSEDFGSELQGMGEERRVFFGSEGRPGSPTNVQRQLLDYLAEEATMSFLQQLTDQGDVGAHRNPSPESCSSEVSTLWAELQPVPSGRGRGVRAQSWVGSQPLISGAIPLHLRGSEGGRPSGDRKRGAKARSAKNRSTKDRSTGTVDRQRRSAESLVRLTSDSESSDEKEATQLMRVTFARRGGLVRASSPEGPGDTRRHPSTRAKGSFLHVPDLFLSSGPRGLTSAVGEQEASSSKKTPSVAWGKAEGRLSYAEATASGGLPAATSWKKVPQEKRSIGRGSNLALGRGFATWGQRVPAPPPAEPVTFPMISAAPLLERNKKSSWAPGGTKQSKHTRAGKRSVGRKTRESEPVAEENDGKGDRVPKGQPAHKPGPPALFVPPGEFSSGGSNIRVPLILRRPQLFTLNQGDVLPRGGPTASGDQELLDRPPRLERRQQLPPGAEGCPRCPVLQREVDELKEQLAAMQSLTDKFHNLQS